MNAGTMYTIRPERQGEGGTTWKPGAWFDPLLRLENAAGIQLAENDDAPGEKGFDSRIDFTCPQDGVYRVVASHSGLQICR